MTYLGTRGEESARAAGFPERKRGPSAGPDEQSFAQKVSSTTVTEV